MNAMRAFIVAALLLFSFSSAKADVQECIAGQDCYLIVVPSDKTDSNTPITNLSESTADFYYYWNDNGTSATQLSEASPDNVNVYQIGTTGNYKVQIPSAANIVTSGNAGKTLCVYVSGYTNITTNRPACVYVKTKTDENTVARMPSSGTLSTLTVGGVWDELKSGHTVSGSFGDYLDAKVSLAGGGSDPWTTPLPGAYGTGTAGNILGNRLDVAISTRQVSGPVTLQDDAITSAKIATDAIGASEIAAGAITSSEAPNLDAAMTSRQPSGNVTVGGYAAGQTPADSVLSTPANKLATDVSGRVTVGSNADKTGYSLNSVTCDISASVSGISFTIGSCTDFGGNPIMILTDQFVGSYMVAITNGGIQCNVIGHGVFVGDVTSGGVVTVKDSDLSGSGFPAAPNATNCGVRISP